MAKFRAAMRADLILSSGGVSVGDYDLVKDIMKEVGNRMQFWQVAMKPGRPLAFGSLGDVPIVGLPGNPVSSMVSFEQFIRPAILKMMGHKNLFRRTVRASLDEDIEKKTGIRHFIRARIRRDGEGYTVVTTGEQGSGILKSMVRANGLIILPEEATEVRKGEMVIGPAPGRLSGAGCRRPGFNQFFLYSSGRAIQILRKCQGHWWASRTSNPEWGASTLPGGFDSHALPPFNFKHLAHVIVFILLPLRP